MDLGRIDPVRVDNGPNRRVPIRGQAVFGRCRAIAVSVICVLVLFNVAFPKFFRCNLSISRGSNGDFSEERSKLYDNMAKDLDERGLLFLEKGVGSKRPSSNDAFTVENGVVMPLRISAKPPVRTTVLHLPAEYSDAILAAVNEIFTPHFDKAIWLQNRRLFHFSMVHASHQIAAVEATENEIEEEASAVREVALDLCPLIVILDRVIFTPSGVLIGCWQVMSGPDPVIIRSKLRAALPRAPIKQSNNAAILHTSIARVFDLPKYSIKKNGGEIQLLHNLVASVNKKIQGLKAPVSELWYVEEYELYALAFDGKLQARKLPLACGGIETPPTVL